MFQYSSPPVKGRLSVIVKGMRLGIWGAVPGLINSELKPNPRQPTVVILPARNTAMDFSEHSPDVQSSQTQTGQSFLEGVLPQNCHRSESVMLDQPRRRGIWCGASPPPPQIPRPSREGLRITGWCPFSPDVAPRCNRGVKDSEEPSDDPDSIGVVWGSSIQAWTHHPRPLASIGVTLSRALLGKEPVKGREGPGDRPEA